MTNQVKFVLSPDLAKELDRLFLALVKSNNKTGAILREIVRIAHQNELPRWALLGRLRITCSHALSEGTMQGYATKVCKIAKYDHLVDRLMQGDLTFNGAAKESTIIERSELPAGDHILTQHKICDRLFQKAISYAKLIGKTEEEVGAMVTRLWQTTT
jgi:hypothetical protein